ncbi:NlpC/P60 family protein [Phyllobacterium sp. A18/5-2]|jgi:NlpC/P60 family putative phage cell wall peptidase|uniref:NlpC/P60 family protein n=1 Tax=Phyllobacterium sp. A18/5-2 TaxID=2978392 RepID=UPI0021C727A2|nr:NlpC/P60 family protein [Phyllobacterium sp. A18/5-2]UXN63459.1 NlpC/P60 family protein [Phyllobacterium sp. A18/5-2]
MMVADEVLAEARHWIGTPYRHGGSKCQVGCDCLGLVRGIWRSLYGREPQSVSTYSADWAEAGASDPLLEAARRHMNEKQLIEIESGDLIVFRWRDGVAAKHLGVLTDTDHFIHAYEGHSVMESALVSQWRKRIAGVFSFPDR